MEMMFEEEGPAAVPDERESKQWSRRKITLIETRQEVSPE
jgi:predicted GIY-YIG superfamily endonuclease